MNVSSMFSRIGLAALLVALLPGMAPAQETGVAARVNGEEIGVFRLERHFEDYLRAEGRNLGAIRSPSVYKRLKRQALDELIDKALLWQEARRRGIEVADAEIRQARAAVETAFRSPEGFRQRLHSAGFDEAAYARYLEREIAASRALAALVGPIDVTEEEVKAAYAASTWLPGGTDAHAAHDELPDPRTLTLIRQQLHEKRHADRVHTVLRRLREEARIDILIAL